MSRMDALLALARTDGPTEARKDAAWKEIETATMGAAIAGTAKGATMPTLWVKLAIVGGLAGAAGIAAIPDRDDAQAPMVTTAATRPSPRPAARHEVLVTPDRVPTPEVTFEVADIAPASSPVQGHAEAPPKGGLAEEARLVTEARAALVRGDGAGALARIEAARQLPSRALEPEELALEARAMRQLGRADEAAAAELRLKARFPSHALAR